jgi:hypothetical protein
MKAEARYRITELSLMGDEPPFESKNLSSAIGDARSILENPTTGFTYGVIIVDIEKESQP